MASEFLKRKAQEERNRRNVSTVRQVVLPTARELSEEAKERLAKSEAFRSGTLKYGSTDMTPSEGIQDEKKTSALKYIGKAGLTGAAQAIADLESAATLRGRVASDKLVDSIINTPPKKTAAREQKDAIAELQRERERAKIFKDDESAMDKLKTELAAQNKEDRRKKLTQLTAPEQKARESYNRMDKELYEESKHQSKAVQKAGSIARSIGYMAPSMAIGGAYGGANAIGTAAMAMQSGGGGYEDARSEGAAAENALRYAIGKGLLTFGTEKAMGAIPGLGKGKLDDAVETLTGKLSNPWMQYLARRGIDRAGESLEEVAEEFLTPFLKRATYNENAELASGRDLLEAAGSGFVISSILGAPADITGARAAMQGSRAQRAGSEIQMMGKDAVQSVIDEGLRSGRDTDSFRRATALQDKINRGELLTEREIGELHYANQNAIAQEEYQAKRDRQDRIRYSAEQARTAVDNNMEQQSRRLSFAFGQDIELYDKAPTAEGVENGYYQNGKIHVNVRSNNPLTEIFAHELTHSTEDTQIYGELKKYVRGQMPNFEERSRITREGYARNGVDLSETEAEAETVANYVSQELLTNEQEIYKAALGTPTLAEKVKSGLDNILSKMGNEAASARQNVARIRDTYSAAIQTATRFAGPVTMDESLQRQIENDGVEFVDGGTSKFSYDTWTPKEEAKVRNNLIYAGYDPNKVDKWISDVNSIAAEIGKDRDRLDYTAADNQRFMKKNSEYKYTLDASTLCAKRIKFQGIFNAIQHQMPNTVLTSDDIIDLVNLMKEEGVEAPCGVCYVESRRRHLGNYAQKWLDSYNGEYMPRLDEVTTTDGLETLRSQHPETYKDFITAMKKIGVNNPKVVEMRTAYRGDVRRIGANTVKKLNDAGGLRVQSFSDFETAHLLDMMQAVADMSSKGLMSQAYTKVPAFAWVFGDTGIKINLSLIAEGTGLDANGNLIFSNVEGMDINDATALREAYPENVGTICVGVNDAQILKLMQDDRIDFIIPFHKSGWGTNELQKMGMIAYKDYTAQQNERNLKTGGNVRKNILPSKYWDYSLSGKENAEKYLALCAEMGRIPKFSDFLHNNGDGTWSLQPDGSTDGYWKMLIDYKMYDNNGVGAPQRVVTPDINMGQAYKILDEYEGYADILPVDQAIVDKYIARYKGTHQRAKYSITPNEDGGVVLPTAEELAAQDDVNADVDNVNADVDNELIEEAINDPAEDDIDIDWTLLESDTMEGFDTREEMEEARRRDLDDYWAMIEEEARTIDDMRTDPEAMVSAEDGPQEKSLRQNISDSWSYFKRKMVDSGEAVTRIGNAVNDNHLYSYYNMARAASNAGISMITDKRTDVQGHVTGKGLNEIFAPIRQQGNEYYNKFQLYLLHMHNVDRMSRHNQVAIDHARQAFENFKAGEPELARYADYQIDEMANDQNSDYFMEARQYVALRDAMRRAEHTRNVPVFGHDVTAEMSRDRAAELLREHPEFEEHAKDVYAYIDNLLQYRVDSGLIRAENMQTLRSIYPHYVPTYRVFDNETTAQQRTRDVIVGSTIGRAEGGTQNIMPLHKALAQQTLSVVREGSKNRFGTRLLQDAARNRNAIAEEVRHVQEYENDFHEDTFDDNEPDQFARSNTFVVRQNGQMYEMTVSPALYEAVKALSPDTEEANAAVRAVREANNLYKKLITAYNPIFVVKNFVRDLQDAGLNTKNSLRSFAAAYPMAIREIATNGQYWQQYKALGGTYSSVYDYDTGNVTEPNAITGRIEALNQAIEQAPRLAEFIATVRNGDGSMDNLMDAMHNAAEVTTNFGRSGTLGKKLNANFIPFLNPSIQGFSKMIRNITETKNGRQWLGLAVKAAVLGFVPTMINELIYGDDDEWDELRDSDKDTNYVFKIGEGKWIKIPKGRVVSLIGMGADRTMDAVQGEEIDWKGTLETAANQTAPTNPLEENILKAWSDADLFDPESPGQTWYGSDIESQRLQGYAPGERYDNATDELSKFIGKTLNVSPKKLNYLMNQYFGVAADLILPLLTPAKNQSVGALLGSGMTIDSVASNKLSNEFYTTMDDLTYAKNTSGSTGVDAVVYKHWNKQKTLVNDINAAVREIEVDESLSNKDRQDLIRAQYAIRNQLERNALDLLEDYKTTAEKYYNGSKLQDEDDKIAYAYREANREIYGAEYALQTYNKDVYAKAQEMYKQGVSYDNYYDMYFEMKEAEAQNTGYQKSNAIRNIIAGAPISENAKKTVYRDKISDSRDDDIDAFDDAGLSFNQYLIVQNKYAEINDTVDGASNKALELARWVEQQGFDEEEAATIKQAFMYYSQIPAQTDKYDAMMGLDIEDESAAEVLSAIAALEPLEGKKSVSDKQKYQAIMDTNLTYNEKLRAFEVYMNESAYEKLNEAVDNGIDMEDYITYVIDTADIKADKDASGKTISGSKKSKILDYINSMPIGSSQKDTLYLMAGYSDKSLDETPWYGKTSSGSIFTSRGGSATFGNRSLGTGYFSGKSSGSGYFSNRSSGVKTEDKSFGTGYFSNRSSGKGYFSKR